VRGTGSECQLAAGGGRDARGGRHGVRADPGNPGNADGAER